MARYIDADALKERMLHYYECVNPNTSKATYNGETLMAYEVVDMVEDCIVNAPEAEVVEVRHAEWIEDGYNDIPCACSHCGAEAHYISTFNETFDYDYEENLYPTGYEETKEYIKTSYCPSCGAKMDGKVTE